MPRTQRNYDYKRDPETKAFVTDKEEVIDSPVIGLRLPRSLYDQISSKKNKQDWIREAILEKLQREENP